MWRSRLDNTQDIRRLAAMLREFSQREAVSLHWSCLIGLEGSMGEVLPETADTICHEAAESEFCCDAWYACFD